jgi:hypothetical protein
MYTYFVNILGGLERTVAVNSLTARVFSWKHDYDDNDYDHDDDHDNVDDDKDYDDDYDDVDDYDDYDHHQPYHHHYHHHQRAVNSLTARVFSWKHALIITYM